MSPMQTLPARTTTTYTSTLAAVLLRQVNPELGDEVERRCERISDGIDALLGLALARAPRPLRALAN